MALLKKFSFPGGVHPPEKKSLTSESEIHYGFSPDQVAVLLSQHIGAICKPLVGKGDVVKAGQKIGDSESFVSAPVHSPVNGKVKEIALRPHAVIGRVQAVIIDTVPENQVRHGAFQVPDNFSIEKYSAEKICEAAREAGLVGMGGAGFPTRVKIEPNPKSPKTTMIVNGCECEPYITCDYRIMLEWTKQIITGVKLAQKASGCKEVFFAIEDNKPHAIDVVQKALADSGADNMKVVTVKTKYPQGGERQLINAVLQKIVPTGGIPPMIGLLVMNVATCAALAEAVIVATPLTHRVVTVTGEAIAKPGNFYVPVGTPVGKLLDYCGGVTQKSARVILGGPMMGLAIADLDTPTTKTTGAITVITREQMGVAKFEHRQTACIRCGRCLAVCPENLNPTKIAHAVKNELYDVAKSYFMSACIECGCCSYVCPANIELTGYIKTGKIYVARQKKRIP
ncbi:MAG: electron transport complex subunit RsxC [Sedimentisphaerales bacterium]